MQWLNKVVDEALARHPKGPILVSSGVSPSGKYHLGTLREVLTAEVIKRELIRRGRKSSHIHVVDDLDALRKVPVDTPATYEKHLGQPLCDIPAPDGSKASYADYFLKDLLEAAKLLKLDMEIVRSHEKYRQGFFVTAIERALERADKVRQILETISGHKLSDTWSPIQVMEDGWLKNRRFISIDTGSKTICCEDKDGNEQTISYAKGQVKLDWRIDWPARWWLLGVNAEPFGRDHASSGGSYDTGAALSTDVFDSHPPLPVPYAFINRAGQTKKMSKSAGDTVNLSQLLQILPSEVVWFFIIRYAPSKQLFFDENEGVVRLIDEYAELLAKADKTAGEQQLLALCGQDLEGTISSVPFSHLVASFQAALKDPEDTLKILSRTEYRQAVEQQAGVIKKELAYIDRWLEKWAPPEVKFQLVSKIDKKQFSTAKTKYLQELGNKIVQAPASADGEWFHKTIYDLSQQMGLEPKQAFETIYKATIGQDHGPRAGWFLSILPRDWLVNRLNLES